MERGEPDARAEEEIAAAVVGAAPEPAEGDGRTPADPRRVEEPASFVAVVRDAWLRGDRDAARSSGRVSSARFV